MVGYGEADGQKGLHFKRDSCGGGGGGGFHRRNLGSMLGNRTWNTEPCNQAIRAVVALYACHLAKKAPLLPIPTIKNTLVGKHINSLQLFWDQIAQTRGHSTACGTGGVSLFWWKVLGPWPPCIGVQGMQVCVVARQLHARAHKRQEAHVPPCCCTIAQTRLPFTVCHLFHRLFVPLHVCTLYILYTFHHVNCPCFVLKIFVLSGICCMWRGCRARVPWSVCTRCPALTCPW